VCAHHEWLTTTICPVPAARDFLDTPYRRGVAAVATVTLVWRAWTASRWTWQDDDWVYLADTASKSLPEYVFQIYNGHLMPGEFLVMWVVTHVAPLNYALPLIVTAIASSLVVVLWGRALSAIGGEKLLLLVPLALISLTPMLIRPTIWWASALQVVSLQACLAWGVLVAARMAVTPSRRDAFELLASLAVGLVFWEKAVLLTLPFVMVLLSATHGRLIDRLRLHLRTLVGLALLAAMYSGLYLVLVRQSEGQRAKGVNFHNPPTWGEAWDFLYGGVGNLLAPGIMGGPWGTMPAISQPFAVAPLAVAMTCVALLISVTSILLLTRRGSWVPLVIAATYVLVSWGLVLFSSRFVVLGTNAINDERYAIDSFTVVVIALVLAAARPRRASPRSLLVPERRCVNVVRAWAGIVVGSLVLGNVLAAERIGTSPAKPWVDAVTANLRSTGPVTLVDSRAPDQVLAPSYWLEYATTSRMLAPLGQVSFTRPTTQLRMVSESGDLVDVGIAPSATSETGPIDDCGYLVEPGADVIAPMSQSLFAWNWIIRVDTFAAEGGRLAIDLGQREREVDIGPGLQSMAFPLTGEVAGQLRLTMKGGTTCVTSIVVGEPVTNP
jgi:hypothetical protein